MPASTRNIRLPGPAALLLAILLCVPVPCGAFGDAPVPGVAVEVRNHEGNAVGANLIDGDTATAWVGGGTGVGPGKWIEFSFPGAVRLSGIRVANGHQAAGQYAAFRRLTKGVILYPDGTRQRFSLKPDPGVQTLRLEPKIADAFRVIITGVWPGAGDKAMGKAKVAVSEMTVLGEMVDPSLAAQAMEKAAAPETAGKSRPVESMESVGRPRAKRNAGPEKSELMPAAKSAPAKKAGPAKQAKPKKDAPKPGNRAPEPKKSAARSKKAAPKTRKSAPKTVSKGATYLRPATEIPADKPLDAGVISPWLDLELVAGIKRYFSHLTTLSDSYPDVFAAAVRERERTAFLALQESVRREGGFGDHHIAMPELIGLSFDKPVESGDGLTIHVHGPCRYYVGDRGFEFQADAEVNMVRENGVWLISGVRDK